MNVLLTGGYIGGVIAERLIAGGHSAFAAGDPSENHRALVPSGAVWISGTLADRKELASALDRHKIEAVIHAAEAGPASQSMERPHPVFESNVVNGHSLLDAMLTVGVKKIVFASTAAVYGAPDAIPVREDAALRPLNPYGESKVIFEKMLRWYDQAYGLRSVILRNFNPAGASAGLGVYHRTDRRLLSSVLSVAAGEAEHVEVFGEDYPTPDGTCIRDYLHVVDLADAYLLALNTLKDRSEIYNLGYGAGYSVAEVIEMARQVTGQRIPSEAAPRRPGDPPILIADADKIMGDLGWSPRQSELDRIIESAWKWRLEHPNGYN
jgi:UDP-glucose 4-epimerase